ncbi:hypothetical protein SteCoe_34413 [Stentor coeruleus]|uniref:SH3 domain-containing protein n=1 Tax=Stentor coeruleus TaxID=5963 RepID=A0A1R2AUK4_9CILI|nr:hypothetical protein SteCoe_34413 [Stentor coeruleus]
MDFQTPPRSGKIKTIIHQPAQTFIEKISPIHTPTSIKQASRASSLIDSKKPQKAYTIGIHKSSKVFKSKIEPQLDSFSRMRKTPTPRSTIVNFVNETKVQEIRMLKSEISILKNALNSATTQISNLKESYEKKINSLQEEKKHYKTEFFHLVHLIATSSDVNTKFRNDIFNSLKINETSESQDISKFIENYEDKMSLVNPFEILSSHKSGELTARFKSLTESQLKELMVSVGEGIILENFYEPGEEFLNLQAGDRVQVLRKLDEKWWLGICNEKTGKFPSRAVLLD